MNDPCRIFEEQLLELVYDELGESDAEVLRMHAASCDRCRTALEDALMVRKLASRLPDEEPDERVKSAVLAEATRFAETQRQSTADEDPEVRILKPRGHRERRTRARLWIPAFAAAALAASVAVVSFILVRDAEQMSAHKDTSPEMVAMESEREAEPEGRPGAASTPAPARAQDEADKREEASAESREELSAGSRLGTSAGPTAKKAAPRERALGRAAPKPAEEPPPKRARPSRRPSRKKAAAAPDALAKSQKKQTRNDFAPSPGSAAPGAARAFSARPRPDTAVTFEEARRALSRGDCKTAIAGFTPWADGSRFDPKKTEQALVGLARCESRRGRCSRAVAWYARLLNRYPSHPLRPSLLWEAAACERKLGRTERAKKYLQELAGYPTWKQRAETQLLELGD